MPTENLDSYLARPKVARVLNFGPPFSGKTYSLITLLKMGLTPLWIFDLDGNAESLLRKAVAEGFKGDDIKIFTYIPSTGAKIGEGAGRPRAQGQKMFQQFIKDFNAIEDLVDPKTGLWLAGRTVPKAVVIDSTTKLQELILDHVLCSVGHDLGAANTDARADFGKQMEKTTEIINHTKALPCVTVFNAHERLQKPENTTQGDMRIDPFFTGEQYALNVAREFTVCVYSEVKKEGDKSSYIWRVRPKGNVKTGGTRTRDDLPAEIPQDYAKVL